jgi:hypothetical protein
VKLLNETKWWVLTPHEMWYLFLFVIIFIALAFLLTNRAHLLKLFNLGTVEVEGLHSEIRDLKIYIADLEGQVKSLQLLVKVLMERSAVVPDVPQTSVTTTKVEVNTKTEPAKAKRINRPVLLVYGVDAFGEQDRQALKKAGITFFRLRSASLEALREELHRRRSDGNLYDIVHISAHGGGEELLFENDSISGNELSDALSGVRGIFLATCSNQKVADKLVGIVKYVIVVYEEIDTNDAANFVFEFYKRYRTNLDVEASFAEAMAVMPQISEFVDLRIGDKE